MPAGKLTFDITGLSNGASVSLNLDVSSASGYSDFYARMDGYGYTFWQSIPATAAALDATRTRLSFSIQDGGFFDADGAANGSISVRGGPVIDYANLLVRENNSYIGQFAPKLLVTDTILGSLVYSITGGAEKDYFTIVPGTGNLLSDGFTPNFENLGPGTSRDALGRPVYTLTISIRGTAAGSASKSYTTAVHVLNDPGTDGLITNLGGDVIPYGPASEWRTMPLDRGAAAGDVAAVLAPGATASFYGNVLTITEEIGTRSGYFASYAEAVTVNSGAPYNEGGPVRLVSPPLDVADVVDPYYGVDGGPLVIRFSYVNGSYNTTASAVVNALMYSLDDNDGDHMFAFRYASSNGSTKSETHWTSLVQQHTDLAVLAPSAGSLSPNYAGNVLNYSVNVTYATSAMTLTALGFDPYAAITVTNGVNVCPSGVCNLAVGSNALHVTLQPAYFDTTPTTYNVTVVRAPQSADATLSALELSAGTLTPDFVTSTNAYTVAVEYDVASMTVTPTVNDAAAIYTVTDVSGACAVNACALAVGDNPITVTVQAENGTLNDYVVVVARANSTDASLSALALSAGVLSPAFDPGTTDYSVNVSYSVSSIVLTPTANFGGANWVVAGASGTCAASGCLLVEGGNTFTVTVTAADGVTVREYVIGVERASLNTPTPGAALTRTPTRTPSPTVTRTPTRTATPTRTPTVPGAPTATRTTTPSRTTTPTRTPSLSPTPAPPVVGELMPRFGPPTGGLPMTLLGNHLSGVTTFKIEGTDVPFTVVGNTRLNFTLPPGAAGLAADVQVVSPGGSVTARDVFTYITTYTGTLNAETGGVVTTTARVMTFTVPPQGTYGFMGVGYDPVNPPKQTPLDKIFAVVRMFAHYKNVPAETLLAAIYMEAKANPASLGDEMRMALFRYVEGGAARGGATAGNWVLVPGEYDSATGRFTAEIKDMGVYALGAVNLRQYWMPVLPRLR